MRKVERISRRTVNALLSSLSAPVKKKPKLNLAPSVSVTAALTSGPILASRNVSLAPHHARPVQSTSVVAQDETDHVDGIARPHDTARRATGCTPAKSVAAWERRHSKAEAATEADSVAHSVEGTPVPGGSDTALTPHPVPRPPIDEARNDEPQDDKTAAMSAAAKRDARPPGKENR
ncbi:hypothetical protein FOMPIDRAFT_1056532 [Fomitopsis schrenkii]|uniref:Uncharacterized protein n=1 Tax=Fomitopsis schrenkii TaxID=2126942 RepID=S8ESW6_FOMSC|nr:hypothetical protein FOMPIDRAFT_1056532 [Fomitopsis schrenkii]